MKLTFPWQQEMYPLFPWLIPHLPPSCPSWQQLRMARTQLEGIVGIGGMAISDCAGLATRRSKRRQVSEDMSLRARGGLDWSKSGSDYVPAHNLALFDHLRGSPRFPWPANTRPASLHASFRGNEAARPAGATPALTLLWRALDYFFKVAYDKQSGSFHYYKK